MTARYALVVFGVVRVSSIQDGWDVAVIVAILITGVAAAAGLIALVPVVRQLRRRPELAISWWFDGEQWEQSHVVEMEPGATIHAVVGLTNVGDAGGETSLYNVIFTDRFRLTSDPWVTEGKRSSNTITGPCTYLAEERRFHIGMTWQVAFMIIKPSHQIEDDRPDEFPLVFELSDERFNARGRRIRFASSIFRWQSSLFGHPWFHIDASPELECKIGLRVSQRIVRRVALRPSDSQPTAQLVKIEMLTRPASHKSRQGGVPRQLQSYADNLREQIRRRK